MSAVFSALLLLAASPPTGDDRLHVCEVEIEGPLERFVLSLGDSATTEVERSFLAGERRTLEIPVAARTPAALVPGDPWPLPEVTGVEGAGSVRPLRWRADPGAAAWSSVPVALRLRSRPPVPEPGSGVGPVSFLLLAAGLVGVLAAGRRGRTAALLAVGVAVPLLLLPGGGAGPDDVVVWEADAASPVALNVQGRRHRLGLNPGERLEDGFADRLEVRPEAAPIRISWRSSGGHTPGPGWVAEAPGAELFTFWAHAGAGLEAVPHEPERALERWVRTAGGNWSGAEEPPPGWLVTGLPMGTGILLARFGDRAGRTWLRLSGYRGPADR